MDSSPRLHYGGQGHYHHQNQVALDLHWNNSTTRSSQVRFTMEPDPNYGSVQAAATAPAPAPAAGNHTHLLDDPYCFEKAAVLIDDAVRGRYVDRDLGSRGALAAYHWHKMLRIPTLIIVTLYLGLAWFEVPSWCLVTGECGDPKLVLMMGMPVLPRLVTESIEIVIVLYLVGITALKMVSVGRPDFFKMNQYAEAPQVVFLALAAIDLLVGLINTVGIIPGSFRLCRWLRPALVVAMYPRLRVVFRNVVYILLNIVDLIVLLLIIVGFAAWFAVLLFPVGTSEATAYFGDYIEAITSLFIASTTSNHPDIMLRAYTNHRAALFFFVPYMLLTTFLVMNLLLAAVYDSYRLSMRNTLKRQFDSRREGITAAFYLLDHNRTGFLDYSDWEAVYGHLRPDDTHARMLFDTLDTDRNGIISKDEFVTVCSVLELRKRGHHNLHGNEHGHGHGNGRGVHGLGLGLGFGARSMHPPAVVRGQGRDESPSPFGMPGRSGSMLIMRQRTMSAIRAVRYSWTWRTLRRIVNSKAFEYGIDIVIALNGVVMVVETAIEFDEKQAQTHLFLEGSEIVFTLLYTVEMVLKHVVWGWRKYWKSTRNVFDGIVTIVALITEVLIWIPNEFSDARVVRVILLTRMLRLIRLLSRRRNYQIIFGVIAKLAPAIVNTMMVLACIFYLFAIVGVQLFGGLLWNGNPDLTGSYATEAGGYFALNFNDFGSAVITQFSLLVVNNWYVIMEGTVAVTRTRWTRLFFVLFYFVCVVVMFNLLVSYVLEHFIRQWEKHKNMDVDQAQPGIAVTQQEKLLVDLFGEDFLKGEEEEEDEEDEDIAVSAPVGGN